MWSPNRGMVPSIEKLPVSTNATTASNRESSLGLLIGGNGSVKYTNVAAKASNSAPRALIATSSAGADEKERKHGPGVEERVDSIVEAAVSRKETAGILHAGAALPERLDQIADLSRRGSEGRAR